MVMMVEFRTTIWILVLGFFVCANGCQRDDSTADPGKKSDPAENMPGENTPGENTTADENAAAPANSATNANGDWFQEVTQEVGLDFSHETGATGELHMPEIMASGAALFDYDLDGDLDIYLTNGASGLSRSLSEEEVRVFSPQPEGPTNQLFRQQEDGSFVNVSDESGLDDTGYGMGVAIGDIDNDGYPDVFLTNLGNDKLYRNRGDGTFEDVTESAGVNVNSWSCSAAFFDYDRDGWLDLFVTRYVDYSTRQECSDFSGKANYCGPKSFRPIQDRLLRNKGDGTFEDVSEAAGIAAVAAPGLGVTCADMNADGWPDVYVANDGDSNHLWINQQDGTFADEALIQGVALNWQGVAEAGMGVVTADLDNDLDLDLFMTHLRRESNTFYRNDPDAKGFVDATSASGLGPTSVAFTGFGTAALDVELDGDLDLPVVNGRVLLGDKLDGVEMDSPWFYYAEPNLFYLNDGKGNFTNSTSMPSFCDQVEITRGLAMGDIDSDGDIDLLISNIQGPARLFRNVAPRQGHWLIVQAIDPVTKRDAIGATVTVHCGRQSYMRTITRAAGYLSSSDPRAHFGLGNAAAVDKIVVRWPDGAEEKFSAPNIDAAITLKRGEGEPAP
jgi:hypothetical protein